MIYKAKVPIGRFEKGDIVGGLTEQQIEELIKNDHIEPIAQPTNQTTTKTAKPSSADNQNLSAETKTTINTNLGDKK